MSDVTLELTIEEVVTTLSQDVDEKFYTETEMSGGLVTPIALGSIMNPKYIVVVAESPGVTFTYGTGAVLVGAYPFGVSAEMEAGLLPAGAVAFEITLAGTGEVKVYAGGDA